MADWVKNLYRGIRVNIWFLNSRGTQGPAQLNSIRHSVTKTGPVQHGLAQPSTDRHSITMTMTVTAQSAEDWLPNILTTFVLKDGSKTGKTKSEDNYL